MDWRKSASDLICCTSRKIYKTADRRKFKKLQNRFRTFRWTIFCKCKSYYAFANVATAANVQDNRLRSKNASFASKMSVGNLCLVYELMWCILFWWFFSRTLRRVIWTLIILHEFYALCLAQTSWCLDEQRGSNHDRVMTFSSTRINLQPLVVKIN